MQQHLLLNNIIIIFNGYLFSTNYKALQTIIMRLLHYNTSRENLALKEYGRCIQNMVDYLMTIEDRDKRNEQAKSVIDLMGLLNPHLKNVEDYRHMLWDHLFAMSDFKLDVDSPYPIPQKETYKLRGDKMKYPKNKLKYAHLGKNVELMIERALQEPDEVLKTVYADYIAYYMKLAYINWHNEIVSDESIQKEMNQITRGKLAFVQSPNIRQAVPELFDFDDISKGKKQNFGNRAGGDTSLLNTGNGKNRSNNNGKPNSNNSNSNKSSKNNNLNSRNNSPSNNKNFKKRY